MINFGEEALLKHKKAQGKLGVYSKVGPMLTRSDLSTAYTPGVGTVSSHLGKNPQEAYDYTIKGNTIAVVSDGSAVLGLGNIGPYGALPVMEGKAILFKELGGVDAYPIVLSTQDPEAIIQAVTAIAPTFGGINLEDIAAPQCFEIERRLSETLDIPVFHDDQHATAIVTLAAIINILRITGQKPETVKIVVNGAGAAGLGTTRLLLSYGIKDIVVCDSKGIISIDRQDINTEKREVAERSNPEKRTGDLSAALRGANIFIGLSVAGALKPDQVKMMADKPTILAMANPVPEIMPDEAKAAGAYIVGTGRSDFPNQINNVLVFPGVFKGLLVTRTKKVDDRIKLAAAKAIASCVSDQELNPENIIPSVLDTRIAPTVAQAIKDNIA